MPKHSTHFLQLARRGAEARYQELKNEIAMLMKAFPHLRAPGRRASAIDVSAEPAAMIDKPRRRRRRSAAARKAVSLRMKAYWARRRRGSAK